MKLYNGFANNPEILAMLIIIMYIYYIFAQQLLI